MMKENKFKLTTKELELLAAVAQGKTNAEIAVDRGLSSETVKSELKRIFRKIGAANRTEAAVRFATGKLE